jgi:hypothetical protein
LFPALRTLKDELGNVALMRAKLRQSADELSNRELMPVIENRATR